ncbi:hypothetical protein DVS77_08825 [Mycolicibacterium moriokaense]|nr:hypothetical protein DVS77_08825 [Mycolicibacterium moriokaense]
MTSNKGWSTDAQLVNGRWIMGPIQNIVHCWSGSIETATENSSLDPATLTGTSVVTYPLPCPQDPPGGLTIQFSLSKIG